MSYGRGPPGCGGWWGWRSRQGWQKGQGEVSDVGAAAAGGCGPPPRTAWLLRGAAPRGCAGGDRPPRKQGSVRTASARRRRVTSVGPPPGGAPEGQQHQRGQDARSDTPGRASNSQQQSPRRAARRSVVVVVGAPVGAAAEQEQEEAVQHGSLRHEASAKPRRPPGSGAACPLGQEGPGRGQQLKGQCARVCKQAQTAGSGPTGTGGMRTDGAPRLARGPKPRADRLAPAAGRRRPTRTTR